MSLQATLSDDQPRSVIRPRWYIVCHTEPRGKSVSERAKILVVDDDDVIRALFKRTLEQAGAEVLLAQDGVSAVKISSEEKPNLVITDGLLPKMHGFLVCKEIKERDPGIKVIIITGIYTKLTYRWQVKVDYLADDLLQKPVTPAELLACIERHLPGRLATNRPASKLDERQASSIQNSSTANSPLTLPDEAENDPAARSFNLR